MQTPLYAEGAIPQSSALSQHDTVLCFVMQIGSSFTAETRALWEQLFTDIRQFDDLRPLKVYTGGVGPDFNHKVLKKGLW